MRASGNKWKKTEGRPAQKSPQAGVSERGFPGRRRVLVVDDEDLVRRTLSLFLTKAGFQAVAVDSADEAIKLLRGADGQEFDLIVTDQSMPGLSGCQLIEAVAQVHPQLPALLVTGYNMTNNSGDVPLGIPALHKPFDRSMFIEKIEALLGAGLE